jgi:benzoyl-CoA reductase/2-hydroxyglutaryl-CoA dehydratase subunit BcrC/BadD/HgdB
MIYFDSMIFEIHCGRVQELLGAKKKGQPVVDIFSMFVPQERGVISHINF